MSIFPNELWRNSAALRLSALRHAWRRNPDAKRRVRPGAQAPQQFKQLIMISGGFTSYYNQDQDWDTGRQLVYSLRPTKDNIQLPMDPEHPLT